MRQQSLDYRFKREDRVRLVSKGFFYDGDIGHIVEIRHSASAGTSYEVLTDSGYTINVGSWEVDWFDEDVLNWLESKV